jgi:seryl-tRNA synthetase
LTYYQAKQDASELLQRKADLERQKKALEDLVVEKDIALQKKIKTIGNYVHDSVPVSNDEVR